MNYEAKYNAALERAKECLQDDTIPAVARDYILEIFTELKESDNEKIRKDLIKYLKADMEYNPSQHESFYKTAIAWLENQGKETDNKVKPKFKVGDWIIRNNEYTGIPVKVIEFKGYYVCELNGEVFALSPNDVHNNFHLWTIQDAKPGDVLAINWTEGDDSWEKIIIFKKYHSKGIKGLFSVPRVEGYGNTFKNGKLAFYDEEVPYYSQTWTDNLQPATKKQRDTLMKAMTDAGYIFDFEKKEPKKIEQKTRHIRPVKLKML